MTDEQLSAQVPAAGTAKVIRSPRRVFDMREFKRSHAGTRIAARVDGGAPTRLPSGEWMQRIALDLPEAMLDALRNRAGGDDARLGEAVRAVLAEAGIGHASHVEGIRDGSYADDATPTQAGAE